MKVSVIVPVYNVESYIRRCIDSLLQQEYDNYEIILVDDGSPDNAGIICDEYAKKYAKVKVFHKVNGGLSSARNYGVQHCEGEWITFVDSDDYVEPNYISDLVNLIKRFKADLAITHITALPLEQCKIKRKDSFEPFVVSGNEAFKLMYIKKIINWAACGKLFRRELLLKYPFPLNRYFEEYATSYLYVCESNKVAVADYINNYHYVLNPNSITTQRFNTKHLDIFKACEEIKNYLDINNIQIKNIHVILLINAVLNILNRAELFDDDLEKVFYLNHQIFRNNLMSILRDTDLSLKFRYYGLLLSTTPSLYKLHLKILKKLKGR